MKSITEFDELPDSSLCEAIEKNLLKWRGFTLKSLKQTRQSPEIECEPFYRNDKGKWSCSRWIGTFNINDEVWHICPRIGNTRFSVIARTVLSAALIRGGEGTFNNKDDDFPDLLPLAWYVSFKDACLIHGMPKAYVRLESNECNELLGELDLDRQLTSNLIEKHHMACRWDDLTRDNPINQATRLTIDHLRHNKRFPYSASGIQQREIEYWRERLPLLGVGKPFRFPSGDKVRWSRANDGFRMPHRIAKWVVERRGHYTGRSSAPAIFIDSAEVWELYLLKRLESVVADINPGLQIVWPRSAQKDYLLDWEGKGVRGLIPDFLITLEDGEVLAVLDAKYRYFRPPTTDPEIGIQMYFYSANANQGRKNAKSPPAALIYPSCLGFNENRRGELGCGQMHLGEVNPTLLAWSIQLPNVEANKEKDFHDYVDKQLKELLGRLL